VSLFSGIVADAKSAVGSQIDALRDEVDDRVAVIRHEVDDRVAVMGASLLRMAIAFGLLVVAALLCGLAIAASLVAFGLSPWVALWCVTGVAAGLGVGACYRVSAKSDKTDKPPTAA